MYETLPTFITPSKMRISTMYSHTNISTQNATSKKRQICKYMYQNMYDLNYNDRIYTHTHTYIYIYIE